MIPSFWAARRRRVPLVPLRYSRQKAAATTARQLCALIRKDFSIDVRISASIGVAMYFSDGEGFESLYKVADETLYRVKDTGKNGYAFSHDDPVDSGDVRRDTLRVSASPMLEKKIRRMLIVGGSKRDLELLNGIFPNEYRIEKAADSVGALTKLRHYGTAISIVLLDWMTPGMDGFQVLCRMRQEERARRIPVIVVSEDETRETTLKVIRAGASDLVAKPVDPDILRLRVESAISRAEN